MYKTIGILAHVDAGKTTLSEAILYRCGAMRSRGRVDDRNTMLGTHPQERARGITIFTDQAVFSHGKDTYTLIDTPGHVDFSAAMARALAVLDAAVLVISAADGVQGHTETIWMQLEALHIPVFIFLNKCDRTEPASVFTSIQQILSKGCIDFSDGMEAAAETLAEYNDILLGQYLEHGYCEATFQPIVQQLVQERQLFPVICGSALMDTGVETLLNTLDNLLLTHYDKNAPFGAQVYGIRRLKSGERLTLLKITGGTLQPRDRLGEDKVAELRLLRGASSENLPYVEAGQVCAALGLAHATIGDSLGAAKRLPNNTFTPLLVARVVCDLSPQVMLKALRILEEEEPALSVEWDGSQIMVHIMGKVQLEVLTELLKERFGYAVQFGTPEVMYQETISAPCIGVGHFEPLRHYAECVLRLEPAPRGSGIVFSSACSTDSLAAHWQNLIETHVYERQHRGVLTGAPLTDIKVTLLAGRAHEKHTEGGDFREAVYRAIRQGLMQAQNIILEPRVQLFASLGASLAGRLLSDIRRMGGEEAAPMVNGEKTVVRAYVPLSEWGEYPIQFAAYTRGRGTLSVMPGDWVTCHNPEDVIAQAGYDPMRDLEHTPDSVFCSHGAGHTVKWDEVQNHMHCTLL